MLHRDIKPSNILLNSDCQVRVCDFGLARSVINQQYDGASNPVLTDYVATRWYRAPEILLGSTYYSKGVDMWSVGCILGELISGKPIFPGTSTMNQLDRVMEVTGRPTPEDIEAIKSPFAATMLESLPVSRARVLSEMFPSASAEALDLLRLCLQFNPNRRISAKDAVKHPYVVQFHNPEDEFDCDRAIWIPIDDNTKLTVQDYRDRLYNEVLRKKKEQRRMHRRNLEVQQQAVVDQQTHHGRTSSHTSAATAAAPDPRSNASAHGSASVHGNVSGHASVYSSGVPDRAAPRYERQGSKTAAAPAAQQPYYGAPAVAPAYGEAPQYYQSAAAAQPQYYDQYAHAPGHSYTKSNGVSHAARHP